MAFYRKWVFPLLAGLLWAVLLTLDLTDLGDSTGVKYAALCLCFATALTGMRSADGKLVAAALCLTVAAEAFVLKKRAFALGLLLFVLCDLCVGACNLGHSDLFYLVGLLALLPALPGADRPISRTGNGGS